MRVVVADDHPLVLEAVKHALSLTPDIEVVGEASFGSQVVPLVARTQPDLVLLDLNMPYVDGLACLEALRARRSRAKVVFFSGENDPEKIEAALRGGAAGFILKSIDLIDLPSMLRQAVAGCAFFTGDWGMSVSAALEPEPDASDTPEVQLSHRETEILAAVARGLSNRAIGKELFLSDQTVKFHLHNIYGKLDVKNRTEAASRALQLGIVGEYLSS